MVRYYCSRNKHEKKYSVTLRKIIYDDLTPLKSLVPSLIMKINCIYRFLLNICSFETCMMHIIDMNSLYSFYLQLSFKVFTYAS